MEAILGAGSGLHVSISLRKTAASNIMWLCRMSVELGLREVLNLGHTVGRAVETVSDYRLLHGEAVAIGLAAEGASVPEDGLYDRDAQAERVIALLKRAKLPTEIPLYIDREKLVKKLYTDKKVRDGKLRFVSAEWDWQNCMFW